MEQAIKEKRGIKLKNKEIVNSKIQNSIKSKEKVREYTILRVILTILVVVGHSTYLVMQTNLGGVKYNFSYQDGLIKFIEKIVRWIYTFHMPLFFMLSGAVYGLSKRDSLDELAKNKFKRLIVPFLYCGIFFMIPIKKVSGFYPNASYSKIILAFLNGGESGHLWFLPTLFWVTIVFYLINKVLKDKNVFGTLLICFFIQKYYNQYITIDVFFLAKGMQYIFWYALGYGFEIWRRKEIHIINKKNIIIFIILLSTVIFNYKYKFLNNYMTVIINGIMLYLLTNVIIDIGLGKFKMWEAIEKYSMSIFLLHDPLEYVVLKLTDKYNLLSISGGSIIYILLRTLGVIIVSMAITAIINKIVFIIKNRIKKKEKE